MDPIPKILIPVTCVNTRALRAIGHLLLDAAARVDRARAQGADVQIDGGLIADAYPLCNSSGLPYGYHVRVDGKLAIHLLDGPAAQDGVQ